MYQVSVIIPIYKTEKYIERCAISLFEQTLKSIEYIFINDCTPDNSIQILENTLIKYPIEYLIQKLLTMITIEVLQQHEIQEEISHKVNTL